MLRHDAIAIASASMFTILHMSSLVSVAHHYSDFTLKRCSALLSMFTPFHVSHVFQVFDKSELTCPKCGKEYSPHCRRFVEAHVQTCDGTPHSTSSPHNKTASRFE
jgi:hypothetical protein